MKNQALSLTLLTAMSLASPALASPALASPALADAPPEPSSEGTEEPDETTSPRDDDDTSDDEAQAGEEQPTDEATSELEQLRERVEHLERLIAAGHLAEASEPSESPEASTEASPEASTEASADASPGGRPITTRSRSPFDLRLGGYGDLQFAFHDYGPNQNRDGGSQQDARLVFDDARFTLAIEGDMPLGLSFEAEVEFEHGGTGVTQEIEYEEFGEFEHEIEKGGEVLLEEFFLRMTFAEGYALRVGRLYVAMGNLYRFHRPTQYLGTGRAEAETTVIPAVWGELGLQFDARPVEWLRITAQLVNGLDSAGFSSQRWVASGYQRTFEVVRATDLAGVLRVDLLPSPGTELGISAYYGGTSRNRPKADLVRSCPDGSPDVVAACGYVEAPLLLLDAHAHFQWGPVRGNAFVLWGHLEQADAITSRNDRLSNALGVLRTPVADEALALWAEIGLNVAPWLGLEAEHAIEPFVRFDHYDTMFSTRPGLFDNPRFERSVFTGGVAYTLTDSIFVKLDASHRWFGSTTMRAETTARLSAGFVY